MNQQLYSERYLWEVRKIIKCDKFLLQKEYGKEDFKNLFSRKKVFFLSFFYVKYIDNNKNLNLLFYDVEGRNGKSFNERYSFALEYM